MATRMIFVRHGESLGNLYGRFVGQGDVPLSEKGHIQAEKTAEYLKDCPIDVIYGSDLRRAFDTGKHIADKKKMKILPTKELREINAGKWEGQLFSELGNIYPKEYNMWLNDLGNAACIGGESVKELSARITTFAQKLADKNRGKTVLCATHATPIRALECQWLGLPTERIIEVPWVRNASVTIVDYLDNGSYKIILDGYDEFMGELSTGLPLTV
ncbi:MAG: histidine phosphatase family protein [Bacillota bacterium]|nr:histidine phosphatase family protein [Bacillota bacterium]